MVLMHEHAFKFHSGLKTPIVTKRSSVSSHAKPPSSTPGVHTPLLRPHSDSLGLPTRTHHRRVVTLVVTPASYNLIDNTVSGFGLP